MRFGKSLVGGAVALAAISAAGFYVAGHNLLGGGNAGAATPAAAPAAMPVPVAKVVKRTIPIYLEYSARIESIRNVALQAKVPGYIKAQPGRDGADVKEGELLYKIDDRDYAAVLDGAKAQVQRDSAALEYARATYARGGELTKSGYLARDAFDQRTSNARQAEASLAQDNSSMRTAEINLSYTEIRAPFAGRLGRDRAPVGTLVGSGGATLNTLVQLDPIYVTFNPSEGDLVDIQAAKTAGIVKVDVLLPGDTSARHSGELTFLDNGVDRATGTITARATVKNANLVLLPGQYVRVRLHVREQPNSLLVPSVALGSSQLGKYVYVVDQNGKAEQHLVTVGASDGDLTSVTGVPEDAQVITGNLQKIGPGAAVKPLSGSGAGS